MLKNIHGAKRTPLTQVELNTALASHERYLSSQGGLRAQFGLKALDGLNLANRNLSDADFAGASLAGATLYGSNMARVSLYCADLRDCNLRSANLTRADLRGASFRGASLSNAVLDNADMRAAVMMLTSAQGVSIIDRNNAGSDNQIAVGVDFSNSSMRNVSLGNAKLNGANFSGAILHGANFKGAQLPNVILKGAVLTGVVLKDLPVPAAALKECVMDAAPEAIERAVVLKQALEAHQQLLMNNGQNGKLANLDNEDLRPLQKYFAGRPLAGLSARNANAIGVDFSGCQLQAARFDGADLRDANFTDADLRGVSFAGAKLGHARFDRANLTRLPLSGGSKLAPDLSGVQATAEQFFRAVLEDKISDLGLAIEST